MPELTGSRQAQPEQINNFLNGNKQVTETDAALAISYYPLLVGLATRMETKSFGEFVDTAKRTYPDNLTVTCNSLVIAVS
jgi:hypothetical protein